MADLVNLLPNESNEVFGELLWTEEKPVEGIEKKHVSDTNASIVIKKKMITVHELSILLLFP